MAERKPNVLIISIVVFLVLVVGLTIQRFVDDGRLRFVLISILMFIGLFSVNKTLGKDIVLSARDAAGYTLVYSILLYVLRQMT